MSPTTRLTTPGSRRALAAACGLALALTPLGAAFAQTAPEQPAPQAAPAPSAEFSEDKLKSFAVAYLQVDRINREYAPRVEEAATPEQQQELREEASRVMVDAVNGADGISPEEYTQIITAAQSDPDLARELNTVIGEAAQE